MREGKSHASKTSNYTPTGAAAVLATKVSRLLQKELMYGSIEEFYLTDSEVVLAYNFILSWQIE